MNITMYDVGFGDCFQFIEQNDGLIVDCGSTRKTAANAVMSYIMRSFDGNMDAMISHFDKDHYIGFISAPNGRFRNIYLSKCIFLDQRVLSTHVLISLVAGGIRLKAKSLMKLLDWLVKSKQHSSNLIFLEKGDRFTSCNHNYKVLWPEVNLFDDITNDSTLFYQNFERYFANEDLPIDEIRDFINKLEKVIGYLYAKNENPEQSAVTLSSEYEQLLRNPRIRTFIERFRSESLSISNTSLFNNIQNIRSKMIKCMNSCSIVFHNEKDNVETDDNNILFCGDATPDVINEIVGDNDFHFHDYYRLIKYPHHATKDYNAPSIPPASKYFISNTERPSWPISMEVISTIRSKGGSELCLNQDPDNCRFRPQCNFLPQCILQNLCNCTCILNQNQISENIP
jgi:hypothetical protein